jgi:hypothetical protein
MSFLLFPELPIHEACRFHLLLILWQAETVLCLVLGQFLAVGTNW